MPYCELNGTQLYYETFGRARPDRPPLLLIHGATGTGAAEWGHIAPLLARDYHVIVPDCRGHGRSPNPQHTYRFAEMADDLAALIRALGHPRAHVIGHSNGGNVALTLLLEHPDTVQCAVLGHSKKINCPAIKPPTARCGQSTFPNQVPVQSGLPARPSPWW